MCRFLDRTIEVMENQLPNEEVLPERLVEDTYNDAEVQARVVTSTHGEKMAEILDKEEQTIPDSANARDQEEMPTLDNKPDECKVHFMSSMYLYIIFMNCCYKLYSSMKRNPCDVGAICRYHGFTVA